MFVRALGYFSQGFFHRMTVTSLSTSIYKKSQILHLTISGIGAIGRNTIVISAFRNTNVVQIDIEHLSTVKLYPSFILINKLHSAFIGIGDVGVTIRLHQ